MASSDQFMYSKYQGFGSEKATKLYQESIQQGPAIAPTQVWSPNQMVSVRELMEDDDFADFIGEMGEFQQNQVEHQPTQKQNHVPPSHAPVNHHIDEVAIAKQKNAALAAAAEETPGSSNQNQADLDKKIKEMEEYMKDYSQAAPIPRPQQFWKKSDVVSMDDLMQFDQELEDDFNLNHKEQSPPARLAPTAVPVKRPVQQTHQPQNIPMAPQTMTPPKSTSRNKVKSFHSVQSQPRKILPQFDSNEALSMLMDIQNSEQPDKFSLIDGFLDKYKINAPEKKKISIVPTNQVTNVKPPRTAMQIWQDICSEREKNQTNGRPKQPAPKAVELDAQADIDLSRSYKTCDAVRNVRVRYNNEITYQEVPVQQAPSELDQMISSNRNNQKDDLYWQRRRINNEAAHRSRSKKKKLIEERAQKISFYEEENPRLQNKLEDLSTELSNLKRRLKMYEEYDAKVSNNGENSIPTYKM